MLSPEYLARIMEGAEEVASQLHTDILKDVIRRIMARLDRGDYFLTSTDKWQLDTLMEAGYLREDIIKDIAKRTGLEEKVVRQSFEDAGIEALRYDNRIYRQAGLSPKPLTESPMLIRMLQSVYEQTMGEWFNITRTTADSAQRLFITECDKAYKQVMSGAKTRSQVVKEAVERLSKDGVTITYPSGKEDTIEVATARAVRTGITQGAAQVTLARMSEMGVDLVLTSSHLGARPTHAVWQGKVFHVGGATDKYPDFVASTRYGYVDGLCGVNCRHSFVPYIEGITTNPFEQFDTDENRKQYETEQEQRRIERTIRKVKREVQGLREAVKTASAETRAELEPRLEKRSQRLTQLNRQYKAYCEANNLKTRQERLFVAGWNK